MTITKSAAVLALALAVPAIALVAKGALGQQVSAVPGIAVDQKAPTALMLKTASGQATKLNQQMGRKGLVLVLTRSAAWCPYCKAQMIGLKDIQAPLVQRGYNLAGLSYDKPEVLQRFMQERAINYVLLSDEGSKMITALDLRDPQYGPGSMAHGVPRPTVLVIAPNGKVRAKMVEMDYKIRPENATILRLVDGLN